MLSKLSRNSSNKVSGRSLAKETLTNIMKDRERKEKLKRFSPRCRLRRAMEILRKTLESGVSSTTSLGTILMNVAQYSHWWSGSKTESNPNLDLDS
jgi:hypothetical protein